MEHAKDLDKYDATPCQAAHEASTEWIQYPDVCQEAPNALDKLQNYNWLQSDCSNLYFWLINRAETLAKIHGWSLGLRLSWSIHGLLAGILRLSSGGTLPPSTGSPSVRVKIGGLEVLEATNR